MASPLRAEAPAREHFDSRPQVSTHCPRKAVIACVALLVTCLLTPVTARALGEATEGEWSSLIDWNDATFRSTWFPASLFSEDRFIAINAAQIPDPANPRLLLWGRNEKSGGETRCLIYDQAFDPDNDTGSGIVASYDATHNLFCSGMTLLGDDAVFLAGGHIDTHCPANDAHRHDGTTDIDIFDGGWTPQTPMWRKRWYPTVTTLPDLRVFVSSGESLCIDCCTESSGGYRNQYISEIYLTEKQFTSSSPSVENWQDETYPARYVIPNGELLNSTFQLRSLNMSTLQWSGNYSSDYALGFKGASALARTDLALVCGGFHLVSGTEFSATGHATVADLSAFLSNPSTSPTYSTVASLNHSRGDHSLVILPDGRVLAVGGVSAENGSANPVQDPADAVLTPEIYDPGADEWVQVAAHSTPRMYHSTAVLLYDGRVFVGGGGGIDNHNWYPSAEIFNPPYLFDDSDTRIPDADRQITSCPNAVKLGDEFTVSYTGTQAAAVNALRVGSVTHGNDMNQRFVPLTIKSGTHSYSNVTHTGTFTIDKLSDPRILIPGWYLLFVLDADGRPKIGHYVNFSDERTKGVAGGYSVQIGTNTTGSTSAKYIYQSDQKSVKLQRVTGVPPNAKLDIVVGFPAPNGITFDGLDLYVENSVIQGIGYQYPSMTVALLTNGTPPVPVQVGSLSYAMTGTDKEHKISVNSSVSSYMTRNGLNWECTVRLTWNKPATNEAPTWEALTDHVTGRLAWH
ncbi:MAG: DUF1929 domain-containing protein [Candidatus Eisenbacteria bacterium]|nr:DUF1929 domain-containing protein [Candidatus Eisenbacteria bacterium]